MALAALQESVTVTAPRTFGTAAWQVPSALAVGMTEQVTTGLVVSITVKIVVQVALSPAALIAVTVIVCVPTPTNVPTAGDWLKVTVAVPLQPPLTVTPLNTLGTAAWQVPSALAAGMTEQVTTGFVMSMTVKVVEQELLLPAASVAVTVIVWTPNPTSVPAAGL